MLKVALHDEHTPNNGRTLRVLICWVQPASDDAFRYKMARHFNSDFVDNADVWDFSYEHRKWPLVRSVMPAIVSQHVDEIAHGKSCLQDFEWSTTLHVNY